MAMRRKKDLLDAYRFPGFYPQRELKGKFGDPQARVIVYTRRSKKLHAAYAVACIRAGMTKRCGTTGISRAATGEFTLKLPSDGFIARAAAR
jgi:hypothetical protein